jgi:4-amino-4-deoxy-L-arabinose transferase-like glycosyltransferase
VNLPRKGEGPVSAFFASARRSPDVILVTALLVAAFALRFVNYQGVVAYPDEFVYTDRALATLQLNWAWSPLYMLDQPPVFMYLLSLVSYAVNPQLYTLRLLSVAAGSLTVIFVYLLGKAMYNRKVGLIAGTVFAFNGFDILYSRLAQQEAFEIFLMAASVYFFWTGVAARKSLPRAVASGVFLGVAVDTKYIAFVLPLAYTVYFLWAGQDWRNLHILKKGWWRELASREYASLLLVTLLFFLPVLYILHQNGVDAFYWQLVGRFAGQVSPWYRTFDIGDLILSALYSYSNVLSFVSTWDSASLFPLYEVYSDLTFLSLVLVLLYYLRGVLRLGRKETFLVSTFAVTALVFLLFPNRFQYYELYTFPAYPVMFAAVVDRAGTRLLRSGPSRSRILRPSVLGTFVVTFLVLGMGVAAGATSAQYGHGAFDDLQPFVQYVANHHEPNLTIAITQIGNVGFLSYYLRQLNVSARILLLQGVSSDTAPPSDRSLEVPVLHTWIISTTITLVPLITSRPQYVVLTSDEFTYTFTSSMKIALAQNYRPVVYSQGFLLLERIGGN